jgi:hypothetical protein
LFAGIDSFGPRYRKAIRAKYRKRIRDLIARIREQRHVEESMGLVEINQRLDELSDRRFAISDELEGIENCPNATAAAILIEECMDRARADSPIGQVARIALKFLQPLLTGRIVEDVRDVLSDRWECSVDTPWSPDVEAVACVGGEQA